MGKALIVSSSQQGGDLLSELLKASGRSSSVRAASGGEARRRLLESAFTLILVNAPLSDEFGDGFARDCVEKTTAGVILFVKSTLADEISLKVEEFGVLVVPKPVNRMFLFQSLKLAEAGCRRVVHLQAENQKLRDKITEIRLVDRAKCALIQYRGLTEPEAHHYIERKAMDRRISRKQAATEVLETFEGPVLLK